MTIQYKKFQDQFSAHYDFRLTGENFFPAEAEKIGLRGIFANSQMEQCLIPVAADMSNPFNKGLKINAGRKLAATLLRQARAAQAKKPAKKTAKSVMIRAWQIARAGVVKFGGKVREYFSAALKLAWAE